jgi:hypothetical protein
LATRFERQMGNVPGEISLSFEVTRLRKMHTEESLMSIWLRKMHIAFEVTRHEVDKSIELKLIDYKNNCLLVSKSYDIDISIRYSDLQRLVNKFELEEVYPILFGEESYRHTEVSSTPTIRLIREN